jgi:tetratricopeptide (TPR) repeat protein
MSNGVTRGWMAFEAEDFASAEREFRRARLEPSTASAARHGLVYVFAKTGRFDDARTECELLQLEAQALNNLEAQYVALHQLGMVERMAEEYTTALKVFAQEAEIIAKLEHPPLAVSANAYEQGIIRAKLGRLTEARDWLNAALEAAQLSGDAIAEACAYRGLSEVAANDTMRLAFLRQSLAAFERGGDQIGANEVRTMLLVS